MNRSTNERGTRRKTTDQKCNARKHLKNWSLLNCCCPAYGAIALCYSLLSTEADALDALNAVASEVSVPLVAVGLLQFSSSWPVAFDLHHLHYFASLFVACSGYLMLLLRRSSINKRKRETMSQEHELHGQHMWL